MSGLRSRYAPIRSGVVGGYVSVDGEQKQVEYSGLGYLCTFAGGCLLFVLGVLGAIAFGFVLRNNSNLHELQKQVAELEMATPAPPAPAPPAPVSDTSAFDALQSQLSDTQEGVSAVHSLYNSVVQQLGNLRESVFALRNGRGNDDDDSSDSGDSVPGASNDGRGPPIVKCESERDCGPQPPCRVAKCIVDLPWFGLTGHCSISLAEEGAACTDGNQSGTCSADGQCVPGQGCVDGQKFVGNWWFPETFVAKFSPAPITLLQIAVDSCTDNNYTLSVHSATGLIGDFREFSPEEATFFGSIPLPTLFTAQSAERASAPSAFPLLSAGVAALRSEYSLFFADLNGSSTPSLCADLLSAVVESGFRDAVFSCGTKLQTDVRVRPYGDDSGFPNNGNPVFLAQQFADTLATTRLYSTDVARLEGYIGNDQLQMIPSQLQQGSLPIGPSPVFGVYPSRDGSNVTTLLLLEHIPINTASELTLANFSGAYAVLNGAGFRIVEATRFGQTFENVAFTDAFYPKDRVLYEVIVDVNTTSLPPFDPALHGPRPTVSSVVPKLDADMSYLELMNVMFYIMHKSAELGETHTLFQAYVNSTSRLIPVEFEDVQRGLLDGSVSSAIFLSRNDGYQSTGVSTSVFSRSKSNAPPNDPSAEVRFPAFFGDATRDNYLLQSSIMYPWFRFSPTSPVTTFLHREVATVAKEQFPANAYVACTYQGLRSTSTPEGASDVDVIMHPTAQAGDGINPATNQSDILRNGTFGFYSPVPLFPDFTFAGVVNPQLVGGRKIGVIRTIQSSLFEESSTIFPFTPSPEFGVARSKQWCVMTQYLNTYQWPDQTKGVDAIIIQSSINFGGDFAEYFGACFGGRRPGTEWYTGKADQTYRPLTNDASITRPLRQTSDDPITLGKKESSLKFIDPALVESALPNSVFTNGTVVLITSTNAVSGGDALPWSFIGKNQDGDLGSIVPGHRVHGRIVGNMNGLLVGGNNDFLFTSFGRSFSNSRLRDASGNPVSIFGYAPETVYLNAIAETDGQFLNNRLDPVTNEPILGLRPTTVCLSNSPLYAQSSCVADPRVPGTFFRPLSSERRDVTYFDFGINETGSSIDGTLYANGHWDSIANGGPTGFTYITNDFGDFFPDQPLRGGSDRALASTRNSWFEEAVRLVHMVQYGSLVSGPATTSSAQLATTSTVQPRVLSTAQEAYMNKTKAVRDEFQEDLLSEDVWAKKRFADAYARRVLGFTTSSLPQELLV